MTVLILINSDVGLYRFRKELIRRLCKDNKVFYALPYGEMILELEKTGGTHIPFEFHRRGMNPFADLGQLLRYIRLLRKIRPDVVLTYTIKPNVYGGLACRITGVPYIATVTGLAPVVKDGGLLGRITTALYKSGIKRAHCVFFQNTDNREFFINKHLIQVKNRLVPGSGVNLEAHHIEDYPHCEETVRFLFVGRIIKIKGIVELLEVMQKLHKTHSNIFLDVIGELAENYSQIISQAEQEGIAKYHGMQFNIHPFYQAAHCVVLPSYHEGMSNVLLEAASTGRPVIATTIPGCRETFDEGVSGFGCQVGDADSLAAAMEKFLALSWEEREAMGKAGREKIEREFDRKIVVDAYMEEIKNIGREG